MPFPSTEAQTFRQLLDAQKVRPAATAVVLRNWIPALTDERTQAARDLVAAQMVDSIFSPIGCANTKDEAETTRRIAERMGWAAITVVTHRSHSYRAFLTFAKSFQDHPIRIYMYTVSDSDDPQEEGKIETYQQSGDVATYEEGIRYIQNYYPPIHDSSSPKG